ncbi:hypothetical protein ABTH92_20395, partial [Acinetobacter baumannii]
SELDDRPAVMLVPESQAILIVEWEGNYAISKLVLWHAIQKNGHNETIRIHHDSPFKEVNP